MVTARPGELITLPAVQRCANGEELAWIYVLNAYEGGLPSARFLGIIADAAEKAGAPEPYVKELRARPCDTLGTEP